MDPLSATRVDFGTLHKFKTSLGVALLALAIAGPVFVVQQLSPLRLLEAIDDSDTQSVKAWLWSSVWLGALLVLATLVAAGFAVWHGRHLMVEGLDGWKDAQSQEDRYRSLFVEDFAYKAANAQHASEAEVEAQIAKEVAEDLEGSRDATSEDAPLAASEPPPDTHVDNPALQGTADSADTAVLATAEAQRRNEIERRRNLERALVAQVAEVFRDTHTAHTDAFWGTSGEPVLVDLALVPVPGSKWTPILVEMKVISLPSLVTRFADQLAHVTASVPHGQFPTKERGRPPLVTRTGLLVVVATSDDSARQVVRTVRTFNDRSRTPIGILARTESWFLAATPEAWRNEIRTALTDSGTNAGS